jgi:UDP-N-acetylmuramate--alanine ligase
VYDDYAHNPEKLVAAITAVRPEQGRLTVIWRPHGFAPLNQNFDGFVDAFSAALRDSDRLLLLPVFYAGGTVPEGRRSVELGEALVARGVMVEVLQAYPQQLDLADEDVVLVAGARDPQLPKVARRLGRQSGLS